MTSKEINFNSVNLHSTNLQHISSGGVLHRQYSQISSSLYQGKSADYIESYSTSSSWMSLRDEFRLAFAIDSLAISHTKHTCSNSGEKNFCRDTKGTNSTGGGCKMNESTYS